MSDCVIRIRDAYRQPLQDTVDIVVTAQETGRPVWHVSQKPGTHAIRVTDLAPSKVYVVKVFPSRHRHVARFIRMGAEPKTGVDIHCPADPKRVLSIAAPAYSSLSSKAQAILAASTLDQAPLNACGQALYDSLDDVQRAGVLNLLTKMTHTPLPDDSLVLGHITSLYRVRGDRVFANVGTGLRDLVKSGIASGLFRKVDGSLHDGGPSFKLVDSYKTPDPYGNLQLTFFASIDAPLRFTADIDIDDAAGIAHLFQVVEHTVAKTDTNPYDIHEILLYHQFLDPGYRLVLT